MKNIKNYIKNNLVIIIAASILCGCLICLLEYNKTKEQNTKAIITQLVSEEKYDEAIEILKDQNTKYAIEYMYEIKELKDNSTTYSYAIDYMESEMYIQASCKFAECIDYKDSKELMEKCIKNAILQDYSEYELMAIMNSIEN